VLGGAISNTKEIKKAQAFSITKSLEPEVYTPTFIVSVITLTEQSSSVMDLLHYSIGCKDEYSSLHLSL